MVSFPRTLLVWLGSGLSAWLLTASPALAQILSGDPLYGSTAADHWEGPSGWIGQAEEEPEQQEQGWLRPLRRGAPDDLGRHVGKGFPLMGTSWLNRPVHAGWLVGSLFGDGLTEAVEQDTGLVGGYRLGWDIDHYWGTEGRIAFAHLQLSDDQDPPIRRTARNLYLDGHLLYYPWGDARLRPFFSLGLGLADFEFEDQLGREVDETLLHTPLGLGCKYLWKHWLAVRFTLMDNLAWGSGPLETMHNLSLTGGVEVRFGRRPRHYGGYR